jgi:Ca2+-binding RTX toxin-like protein
MADFTGTASDEIITPDFVSSTVTAIGGAHPSNAADTINAGGGNDRIESDGGDDVVIGGPGNDTANLGAGNDTFIWNPGDGSDIVEGASGTDTLLFNGSNVGETMMLSANGGRARLFRDVGNITMDLNSMEHIDIAARGSADNITVDDLAGTGVRQVAVDLSGTPGSGTGDGATDTVTVNGTSGDDHITVSTSGNSAVVSGLAAKVTITGAEAGDRLVINGLDGNDTVTFAAASGAETDVFLDGTRVGVNQVGSTVITDLANVENLAINGTSGDDVIRAGNGIAALTNLTINGGAGNDTIFGGDGADLINSGSGNDTVIGGRGNDTALLGSGDDTFIWNPGDGSDIVEGQGGFDTLLLNGSNVAEKIEISANGSRVRFTRDVGNITMDLNSIERIEFDARGGADTITVDDLSGTGAKQVAIDLSGTPGSGTGDGAADTVIVNGSTGNDHISVASDGTSVVVSGLAAQVTIDGAEATNDTLVINALDGNDRIDASALLAGQINLVLNGGTGNDTLIGSAGNDMLSGGIDTDTFVFSGSFGHDTVGDFLAGSGNGTHDFVEFDRSIFSNFADVLAHAQQIGNDTTITVDPNRSITLQNVVLSSLTASDFRFV